MIITTPTPEEIRADERAQVEKVAEYFKREIRKGNPADMAEQADKLIDGFLDELHAWQHMEDSTRKQMAVVRRPH